MPVNVTCQVSLSPMTMSHFASLLALSPVFVWSVQYAFVSAWVWFWCNVAFCKGGCGRGGEDWLTQCFNVVAWGNGCWSYSWQVGKVVAVHWGNRVGFGGALRSSQLREGVLHQHSVTEPRMLNVKCAGSSPQEKGCGLVAA